MAVLQVGGGAAFATIQDAVDHAGIDDVIDVATGTYPESVDWSRMGSAVNRSPGNLTIRGASANVIVHSPQGAAVFNSTPLTGNLVVRQLILESPTSNQGTSASGVSLRQVTGDVTIADSVFQQSADHGLDLFQTSGAVLVNDSRFVRIGDGAGDNAIRLREVAGSVVLRDNSFDNVADRAFGLTNDTSDLILMLDSNTVEGDGAFFSTTDVGFDFRLGSSSTTDISLVNNQIDGMAESAVLLAVHEDARLQARLTQNNTANIHGSAAMAIVLHDSAQVALSGQSNIISDTFGDGWNVLQHGASRLNAVLMDNLFLNIGDDSADQALAIVSDSSGDRNLRIHKNDFATVAGDGLLLTSTGSGPTHAIVTDNVFTEVDNVAGASALAAFRAEAAGSGTVRLRLHSNTVLDGLGAAFFLGQSGLAAFRLEGTLTAPHFQIEADNVGSPVTLQGIVNLESPGILEPFTPLLLGGSAWLDTDGDGVLHQDEPEVPYVKLSLSGTETGSGTTIHRETLTDGRGDYLFSGLLPGDYRLTVTPPQGRTLAPPHQGDNAGLDSDFDRITRRAPVGLTVDDDLTVNAGFWANWQNPVNRLDVDNDSLVVPRDVLLIINDLNANGSRALPEPFPATAPPRYLDVDGNGFVAPLDVLQVINYLNAQSAGGAEGESANSVAVALRREEASRADRRGFAENADAPLRTSSSVQASSRRSVTAMIFRQDSLDAWSHSLANRHRLFADLGVELPLFNKKRTR